MTESVFDDARFRAIAEKGRIEFEDVVKLRRRVFEDGVVSQSEADLVFELNDSADYACPEWTAFFLDSIVDFTVRQVEPYGYVGEDAADWLVDRISADGVCKSATELELLIRIMERAKQVPHGLVRFALEQVKQTVVEGHSACIGGDHTPGRVDDSEVVLLRRILFAPAGEGFLAVSRAEAEVLLDIEDAVADAANVPAWLDLYAKAIGNSVLAASGYTPPSRQEALRRDAWLNDTQVRPGRFAVAMAKGLGSVFSAYRKGPVVEQQGPLVEDSTVDAGEVDWLVERIRRDGKISAADQALLLFLKQEAFKLHPALAALIEEVEDVQAA